ncbi:putative 3-mercaptopyruvate sulfurtransferase [Apostichopus japonicus]|uniref:Putative 3-mercaptopyruvate sulfurtransferase n=1 Tax=Stichopus japonicus TaxID=307972 RepID=A0A2G8JB04_STIJA|nr:putative 3-mercaptopyruvate sulfurtransferase [Apostichopus japonicus]
MKADGRQPQQEYAEKHIPGAMFFDIDKVSDQTSPYSHALPQPWLFSDYACHLGISNDTHVVVYDNHDKFSAFSSPRAWWMLRVFGHQRVSVLEGGLPKWIKEGHPVTSEVMQIDKTEFDVNYQPHLLKKFEDMVQNLSTHSFQVMDARSSERFAGTAEEPSKETKGGHIPYSHNIPFTSLFNSETRTFKSPEEMKEIFDSAGIDLNKPLASSCGSGITACIIALGAHIAGKEDVGNV